MEVKEAFHKWANSGKTLVAYGPREEAGTHFTSTTEVSPKSSFEAKVWKRSRLRSGTIMPSRSRWKKGCRGRWRAITS